MSSGKLAGTVLADRYELDAMIGRGGVCEVWSGRDLRLDRDVAVKVLRDDVPMGHTLARRFVTEVRATASLNHPNIVTTYDVVEIDDRPYLILERLPGTTLADRLPGGPLATEVVLRLASDVLAGLGEAHRVGLVHRDVKPTNLLDAVNGHWKVADFGIAKSLSGPPSDETTVGVVVGTPSYLAPEQIMGQPATPATDLYAVSVVAYEALAGRRPFTGDAPIALARSICADDAPPLDELRPDLSPAIVSVIAKGMAKEPSERFASAQEMASALGPPPAAGMSSPGDGETVAIASHDPGTVAMNVGPAGGDTVAYAGLGAGAGEGAGAGPGAGASAGARASAGAAGARAASPQPGASGAQRKVVALFVGAAVLVGVIALLSSRGGSSSAGSARTGGPAPVSQPAGAGRAPVSITAGLDGALRGLEDAVASASR